MTKKERAELVDAIEEAILRALPKIKMHFEDVKEDDELEEAQWERLGKLAKGLSL